MHFTAYFFFLILFVVNSSNADIHYTNPYDHLEYTEEVTPHELIARLMTHIPDPWDHTTRNYGF